MNTVNLLGTTVKMVQQSDIVDRIQRVAAGMTPSKYNEGWLNRNEVWAMDLYEVHPKRDELRALHAQVLEAVDDARDADKSSDDIYFYRASDVQKIKALLDQMVTITKS